MPDLVEDSSDSESESDDSSDDVEDEWSDDDDLKLVGVCGGVPIGADTDEPVCLIGKFVVKEFYPAVGNVMKLFAGEVQDYNQKDRKFTVFYFADKVTEQLTCKETMRLHQDFESWYAKVSKGGRKFTRAHSLNVIVKAYAKERVSKRAKKATPMDLTGDASEGGTDPEPDIDDKL